MVTENKRTRSKMITGIALFAAVEIALSFLTNYVTIGNVNINLGLIPIIIAGAIYGPFVGCIMGLINGVITIVAPSTLAFFFTYNPLATIILCLLKTSAAGFLSGLIVKLLKNKNIAIVLASITTPLVNTAIFIVGVFIAFQGVYENWNASGMNIYLFVVTSVITINFLIEIIVSLVLCPVIYHVIKKVERSMA